MSQVPNSKKTLLTGSIICALTAFLTSCNSSDATSPIDEINTPSDNPTQTKINTVNRLTLDGKEYTVNYTPLLKTGYADNGEIYGALKDENGQLIKHPDGSTVICNGTSNSPTVEGSGLDFTSLIEKEGKIHLISQFECQVGAMYTTELEQSADGKLTPKAGTLKFIDQSAYKGGWVHCAGSITPWGSHIGSEEYEPDARNIEEDAKLGASNKYYASAKHYFGGDISKLNPYFYGWIPEVKIENGEAVYTKHYAMGRISHELAYIMPDKKTLYLTDDGANDGFYRFVANTAEDLSSGTLYAAKWKQTSSNGGGVADISWIKLGTTNDVAIKALATSGTLKFSDVLASAKPIDEAQGTCPVGFTFTNTETGRECLAFKDVNGDGIVNSVDEGLAAALETRRVAAMKGATTEFRKFEGFTYNKRDHKAYIAISAIERGMEAGYSIPKESDKYDRGGQQDINLAYNKCGAVYELALDDSYTVTSMTSIVEGLPLPAKDAVGNSCHADYISNPDNVAYIAKTGTLLIAEDSGKHTNNIVWAYNLDTKSLKRTATVPLDAETTGAYWQTVGNYNYISLVSQHPMKDQNVDQTSKESSIGLIGPFLAQ